MICGRPTLPFISLLFSITKLFFRYFRISRIQDFHHREVLKRLSHLGLIGNLSK